MKIAYIELHCHVECLYSFCKIFADSDHQLTIYTTANIYSELEDENFSVQYDWKLIQPNESIKKFLRININSINEHDIVLIATIQTSFSSYANMNYKPITIFRIHNVNRWLNPWKNLSIDFSPYILYKDLSYIVICFYLVETVITTRNF